MVFLKSSALVTLSAFASLACAQTGPVAPVRIHYRYVPDYFVEWLNTTDQPYSIVEAFLDESNKTAPAIEIVLTERAGGKRVHYVNAPQLAKTLAAEGDDVHLANISYKAPENTPEGARVWAFGLKDTQGTTVLWRFLQGSDFSEAGQGLNPPNALSGLRLEYRENGAVAGEGSVVQVGASVNKAEVWQEHSTPPYFFAYHGDHTHGIDVIDILPMDASWTSSGSAEAGWQLSSSTGDSGSLKAGNTGTPANSFLWTPSAGLISSMVLHTGASTAASPQLRSIELGDKSHPASLVFEPESGSAPGAFAVYVRKKKIAEGTTQTTAQQMTLSFTLPVWAAGKQIKPSGSLDTGTDKASAPAVSSLVAQEPTYR